MRLVQRHGLFHTRTYEIAGNELVIESNTLSSGDTARYPLFDLSDATERHFRRHWPSLAGAALCLVFALVFANDALTLRAGFPLVATAFLLFFAAGFWLLYLERSYDQVIFIHWQSHARIFILWNNKPDPAAFQAFRDALVEKIRGLRVDPKLKPEQKLELYGRSLAFLVQEEVLTPDEARVFYERKEKALAREKANVISLVPGTG